MTSPLVWLGVGFLIALLVIWLGNKVRQRYRHRHYGDETTHAELLGDYSRRMVNLIQDQQALNQLMMFDIPASLDVKQAIVLCTDDKELVSPDEELRLPIHNAAVRRVAAGGAAVKVTGQLKKLIKQGRIDLSWTAVWVPIMRGTDLYGMWLLGPREHDWAYSSTHLHSIYYPQVGIAL
jgi:hypothetical protein